MIKKYLFLFLLLSCFVGENIKAQSFYTTNTLQKVEVFFNNSDWDYQMDILKNTTEGYYVADYIRVNGVQFDSVGIKYKGNSSYDSTYKKNPIHISFDKYKPQNFNGIKDIKLSNGYGDPSLVREVLAYDILGRYMDAPRANFAQLYINNKYVGIYTNDENVDKSFCADHYGSSTGTFIKCNPILNPSPTTKSNLKYITADSTAYSNFYEIKSKTGWNKLVRLCDTVTNYPARLSANVDTDRALWMLAFNNGMVNLDSYTGVFCQNYYLYQDATMRYLPIVWDLNMSFGGFAFAGSGATSTGTLTLANMQQLPPTLHSTDVNWPLIKAYMADVRARKQYFAHLRTLMTENISNNYYTTRATQLQSIVDTAALSDTHKFYTYAQFQNGITTNVANGSFTIPGIGVLMQSRLSYLQTLAEYNYTAPSIAMPTLSTATPTYNTIVAVQTTVTNTSSNAVYLNYRYKQYDKFTQVLMYDDGAHGDGAANDNIYAANIALTAQQVQYYIYAENTNAGKFSPERAEHEFYTINVLTAEPTRGEVVINELLANNNTGNKDEYNEREDWVELYNTTNKVLNLSNLRLSNPVLSVPQWQFPANTSLLPNEYLIIWTDNDPTQQRYHTNFNLNKAGASLWLTHANTGTLIDSVSYATQTADVSYGRYPNGTGAFTAMTTTFAAANTVTATNDVAALPTIKVFPNPTTHTLSYQNNNTPIQNIIITNALGQVVETLEASIDNNINISHLNNGLYLINFVNTNGSVTTVKVLKL